MKFVLKAHGTKRLKLKYDGPLSNFGFKFNLRRYTGAADRRQGPPLVHFSAHLAPFLSLKSPNASHKKWLR